MLSMFAKLTNNHAEVLCNLWRFEGIASHRPHYHQKTEGNILSFLLTHFSLRELISSTSLNYESCTFPPQENLRTSKCKNDVKYQCEMLTSAKFGLCTCMFQTVYVKRNYHVITARCLFFATSVKRVKHSARSLAPAWNLYVHFSEKVGKRKDLKTWAFHPVVVRHYDCVTRKMKKI